MYLFFILRLCGWGSLVVSFCDTHNILDFILHCSSICGTILLMQSPCEKLKANIIFHQVQTCMNEFMVWNAKISTKNLVWTHLATWDRTVFIKNAIFSLPLDKRLSKIRQEALPYCSNMHFNIPIGEVSWLRGIQRLWHCCAQWNLCWIQV